MKRSRIKHVETFKDRHKKERIYYRNKSKGGKRIALRGPIGSDEFWEDYRNAQSAKEPETIHAKKGEMGWLINQYFKSAAFKQLGEDTQYRRRRLLKRFCDEYGRLGYKTLQPKHVRKIRDKMADTPMQANNLIKALKQVFVMAVEYDLVERNPIADVARNKPKKNSGFRAWTPEERERFETRHPIGTKERLAYALLLYTAQRRSDVVTFGRQHERDGDWLYITQKKTGKALQIPIFKELREVIDASPTGDMTYLVTSFGKPFTSNGFGNWFRKACDEAGLTEVSAHGLRKTALQTMAEEGHSSHELGAIGGHESLAEIERYTRNANQKKLAERVRNKRNAG